MKIKVWGTQVRIVHIVILLLATAALCRAELITIGLTAVVTDVDDESNWLQGQIQTGNTITGYYTYDFATPDTNPEIDVGLYQHHLSPCGVSLSLPSFVFSTDYNNVQFNIGITNNLSGDPLDVYSFRSYNNLSIADSIPIHEISWQLYDYTGIAFSNTDLPTIAPILSDFQYDYLYISGGQKSEARPFEFLITGHVTYVQVVPEPATVSMVVLGILLISRKSKKG